ncbi:MAG: RDD family protein [Turicibacter sp.]
MEKPVYVAGFIKRMNAHAIDLGITMLAVFICAMSLNGSMKYIITAVVFYILVFLIPTLTHGQTIGKKLFKVQPTLKNSNQPLTWWQLHLREATKYVLFGLSFGITHLASFVMASERNDRRTIHDLICGTHVIDLHPDTINTSRDNAAEDDYYSNYKRSIR